MTKYEITEAEGPFTDGWTDLVDAALDKPDRWLEIELADNAQARRAANAIRQTPRANIRAHVRGATLRWTHATTTP